ncbi:MAG: AmmeMemoRadiSam system protein B [Thermodesulfobacteriota bacterium]
MKNIRPSIGGAWYQRNPRLLVKSIERYISNAELNKPVGEVVGIIAPHAGHMYSGQVAAYAYKCIRGMEFETVVIVSPSHFLSSGNIITSSHDAYETPLGTVEIDKDLMNALNRTLMEAYKEELVPVSNDPEHAVEVELPFLQYMLGSPRMLPVMLYGSNPRAAKALGHSLARVIAGRKVLLIASSDLSHFYPDIPARKFDGEMLRRIGAFDPDGVSEAESEGAGFACGSGAIAAVLWACRDLGADRVEILNYANSGDVTGDYESVVGYAAAVIVRTGKAKSLNKA